MNDMVLAGGRVLDPDLPLEQTDVRLSDGRIAGVGAGLAAGAARTGADVIDATGKIVMPGLVNGHTHSGQSLHRGMAPSLPLELWMIWAVLGGPETSVEDVYTTAAAGALDMLRSGCTSALDHVYLPPHDFATHAEAVTDAYRDTGLRVRVAPMMQDLDLAQALGLDGTEHAEQIAARRPPSSPEHLLTCLETFIATWEDRHPLLAPALGPSAPERCSDRLLAGVARLAAEHSVPVHTHLHESRPQVLATRARFDASVVHHLDRIGLLGPHTSFAHCVWLTVQEYRAIAARGGVVVHNPVSNLRLGSGIMPLRTVVANEAPVALGTDGGASNDGQNMFETLKLASILQTVTGPHRQWLQPVDVWAAGLRGGAAATDRDVGSLRPGALADLVVIDGERHAARGKEQLVASIVTAELGQSIDTVIVGGRCTVRDGEVVATQAPEIRRRAREFAVRLDEGLEDRKQVFDRLAPLAEAALDRVEGIDLGMARTTLV